MCGIGLDLRGKGERPLGTVVRRRVGIEKEKKEKECE